jgi:hypothetical protein
VKKKPSKKKPSRSLGAAIRELHETASGSEIKELKRAFHIEFHGIQREVAALVTEMRTTAVARDNIGAAVARIESDVRALIKAISDASDELAGAHLRSTIRQPLQAPADVLPFPAKKRRKKKPEPPDGAA